jgi:hypothetical protein
MTRATLVCAAVLLLVSAVPSSAQNAVTMRGFADAGLTVFTATQSFKAVLGSPTGAVFGGGVEVGLTRNVFVSLAASRFKKTGQRVFVFQNQVFKLNVDDTVAVTPLQVSAGYRFRGRRPRPNNPVRRRGNRMVSTHRDIGAVDTGRRYQDDPRRLSPARRHRNPDPEVGWCGR